MQSRFPILLALNKADMADSARHIARVRAAHPMEPAVAVSAATERQVGTRGQRGCFVGTGGESRRGLGGAHSSVPAVARLVPRG